MKYHLTSLTIVVTFLGISFAQDRSEWFEFYLPWNDSTKTVTDLSSYLDPPAGKHGFLQVTPDGHFKFEKSDKQVRLVGANLVAASCFPEKQFARPLANRLAKFGINIIRIHAIDGSGTHSIFANSENETLELDVKRLDKLDYFIKCLKDKGIYFNFCVQTWRFFKAGDGIDAPIPRSELVTLYNKKLIDHPQGSDCNTSRALTYCGQTSCEKTGSAVPVMFRTASRPRTVSQHPALDRNTSHLYPRRT